MYFIAAFRSISTSLSLACMLVLIEGLEILSFSVLPIRQFAYNGSSTRGVILSLSRPIQVE